MPETSQQKPPTGRSGCQRFAADAVITLYLQSAKQQIFGALWATKGLCQIHPSLLDFYKLIKV